MVETPEAQASVSGALILAEKETGSGDGARRLATVQGARW